MENEGTARNASVYSHKVKAGRKRTYFFDVMKTRGNDFYLTLTESTRRSDGNGYTRHQIFLYKEDFNRFAEGLNDVINHVKTDLMPDFDYDQFAHRENQEHGEDHDSDGGDPGPSKEKEDGDHMSW
ncbi:MAG: DUF3276 family protein [Saprospiraceae bacterium]